MSNVIDPELSIRYANAGTKETKAKVRLPIHLKLFTNSHDAIVCINSDHVICLQCFPFVKSTSLAALGVTNRSTVLVWPYRVNRKLSFLLLSHMLRASTSSHFRCLFFL